MSAEEPVRADAPAVLMRVTPDNVLRLHHAVRAESVLVLTEADLAQNSTRLRAPGQDPVSVAYTPRFQAKIDAVIGQCAAYGNQLRAVADELAGIARRYGHTEDEITESFQRFNDTYQTQHAYPPPTPAPDPSAAPDRGPSSVTGMDGLR